MHQLPPILCTEEAPNENQQFCNQSQMAYQPYGMDLQSDQRLQGLNSQIMDKKTLLITEQNEVHSLEHCSLIQYFHIRRFINRIMNRRKQISTFTKYHFDVINDLASSFNLNLLRRNALRLKPLQHSLQTFRTMQFNAEKVKRVNSAYKYWKVKCKCLSNLIHKIPLVHPESKLKVRWDCFILVPRIYFIFVVPIDLSWDRQQFLYDYLLIPTLIGLFMLVADFIFSFSQSFYECGQLVTQRRKIAMHVISKAYGVELASVCILITFLVLTQLYNYQVDVNRDYYYLLLASTFVQLKNIAHIKQQLEDALNISKAASSLVELSKLFFLLCYMIHLFSCLWYWVGSYSDKSIGVSWITKLDLATAPWGTQYLYSFYYSTVTMFTVGYGDITPQSNAEFIVSIIFMMICSIQLSYSVNTVGAIIDKITVFKEEKKKKFHIINSYMYSKNISYELQYQVREYLNYYWSEQNQEETEQENSIIHQLSSGLKDKLIFEANSRIINNQQFFNRFSLPFKTQLIGKIRQVSLQPESNIDFSALIHHKKDNSCVCFIESGQVEIYVENDMSQAILSKLSVVNAGQSFAMLGFITDKQSIEKYKTVGFTKLLILARRDFMHIIKDYPEDYQRFCECNDDLLFSKNPTNISIRCLSCQSSQHQTSLCPMLHFVPDRERIIKSFQFSNLQSRSPYPRRRWKVSTFKDKDYVHDTAKQIQEEDWIEFKLYDIVSEEQNETEQLRQSMIKTQIQQTIEIQQVKPIDTGELDANQAMKKSKRVHRVHHQKSKKNNEIPQNITKTSKLKQIFRRAVRRVIMTRLLTQGNQKNNQTKKTLKDLLQRKMKIIAIRPELSKATITELDMMESKLRMLVQMWSNVQDDYDKLDTFKYYKHNDNYQDVVQRVLISEQLALGNVNYHSIIQLRQKLLKYMLYPQQYIQKYKQHSIEVALKAQNAAQTIVQQHRSSKLMKVSKFRKLNHFEI